VVFDWFFFGLLSKNTAGCYKIRLNVGYSPTSNSLLIHCIVNKGWSVSSVCNLLPLQFFFTVWNCERTDASLKILSVIVKLTSFWYSKNESFSIRLLNNFEISVLPLPQPRMERWHVRNCIYALCNGICVWLVSNKVVGFCFYVLCLFREREREREMSVSRYRKCG
jgi:hypothetical protein